MLRQIVKLARRLSSKLTDERPALSIAVSVTGLMTAIAAMYAGLVLQYSPFLKAPLMPAAIAASYLAVVLAFLASVTIWFVPASARRILLVAAAALGLSLVLSGEALIDWALEEHKNPLAILVPVCAAFGFATLTLMLAAFVADVPSGQAAEGADAPPQGIN
ncbi:MAG: hypothetical protein WC807_00370 [Hyphomicrobium sp.]|jgi:hypothetical protein